MQTQEMTRACGRCKQHVSVNDFPVAKAKGALYVRGWCRPCLREYYRERGRRRTARAKGMDQA